MTLVLGSGNPTMLVPLALWGWVPFVLILFATMSARRAVLTSFILGWLFLPVYAYPLKDLPDYTKMSAISLAALLGVVLFDRSTLMRFRFTRYDLPMLLWCLCPGIASLSNDLGSYDALSQILDHLIVWGLPYLIGRVYFSHLIGLRELAIAVCIGGLIYIPFCLYEMKMSPQLHDIFYGFHQHSFGQTKRWGGWRPMVFMEHGLAVGMWMSSTALIGLWIWLHGRVRQIRGLSMAWLVAALFIVAVMCRSSNAILLLIFGVGILLCVGWLRSVVPILILILIPMTYMATRASGLWSGENLVPLATMVVGEERAESLLFRLEMEAPIIAKAMEKPIFGWGTGSRFRPGNEDDADVGYVVTDGLWVIALGKYGVVGLVSLTAILLLPIGLLVARCPVRLWTHPAIAPAAVMSVQLVLYMIDCLPNAMLNPVFTLCAGAIIGSQMELKKATRQIREAKQKLAQQST